MKYVFTYTSWKLMGPEHDKHIGCAFIKQAKLQPDQLHCQYTP